MLKLCRVRTPVRRDDPVDPLRARERPLPTLRSLCASTSSVNMVTRRSSAQSYRMDLPCMDHHAVRYSAGKHPCQQHYDASSTAVPVNATVTSHLDTYNVKSTAATDHDADTLAVSLDHR